MFKTLGYGILGLLAIVIGIPLVIWLFVFFIALMKANALAGLAIIFLVIIFIIGLILRAIFWAIRTAGKSIDKLSS